MMSEYGKPCPHCSDGHERPFTHPWSVSVGPQRDSDGQPLYLMVGKAGLQHVAEEDAEWLRQLMRTAKQTERSRHATR